MLSACAGPAPPASGQPSPGAHRLKLATWNVHNFFDSVDDPYGDDVPGAAEVEAKMDALAVVLRSLDADVLGLQEVEKRDLLARLVKTRLQGMDYGYFVLEEGNDRSRGIDVALLSRLPLERVYSHKNLVLPSVSGAPQGYRFSRDCLEVHVGGDLPLVVLVNHFKARSAPARASDAKRRAQALGVAGLAADLERGSPPVRLAALGDFNDPYDSWSLEPLRGRLRDPLGHLALEQRYTLRYRSRAEILDHILVNEALAGLVDRKSSGVFRSPAVRETSDHYPVYVEVRY